MLPRSTPALARLRAIVTVVACCAGLAACRSGPTLDDARDLLRAGDPGEALAVARRAASRVEPEERAAARRLTFQASLALGSTPDAAREYELLRRVIGQEDEALLAELAQATLRLALGDADPARRLAAVDALQPFAAADPRAAALVRAALGDARPEVRAAAARRCAPDAAGGRALAELGRTDPSPRVRREALATLAARGDALSFAAARDALADPDEEVRVAAIRALAAAGADRREERAALLRRQVALGSEAAREAAALALRGTDGPAVAWSAWREAGLAAGGADDAMRDPLDGLGRALRAGAAPDDAAAREALRRALAPTSPWRARLLALRALDGGAASGLVAELVQLATDDPTTPTRAASIAALRRVDPAGPGGVAARRGLERLRRHTAPSTRRAAFVALLARGDLDTTDLTSAIAADDPALATDAVLALRARDGAVERAALVAALDRAASFLPALEALAGAADRGQRERFLSLLEADDPRVRAAAARGVGAVGGEPDRRPLLAMLEAPDGHDDLPAAAALLTIQERLHLLRRPQPGATAQ